MGSTFSLFGIYKYTRHQVLQWLCACTYKVYACSPMAFKSYVDKTQILCNLFPGNDDANWKFFMFDTNTFFSSSKNFDSFCWFWGWEGSAWRGSTAWTFVLIPDSPLRCVQVWWTIQVKTPGLSSHSGCCKILSVSLFSCLQKEGYKDQGAVACTKKARPVKVALSLLLSVPKEALPGIAII